MARWMLAACTLMAAATADAAEVGKYLGPCALVASRDGKTLYVAEADARRIAFVDLRRGKAVRSIGLPGEPSGLALSPDGTTLYVTCAAAQSTVCVIDTASGKVRAAIPAGHTATGPAASPDGKRLYVCNRFSNDVSVIDLEAGKETARVPASREPCGAAVTPDGKSVLVINHLPAGRADRHDVAAAVTVIDTATHRTAAIRLPSGACGLRGLCVSPDGKYAYVTHILARYELPTTQIDYGWINANALSVVDTARKKRLNTVLLDDMDLGAANPWGVACTPDGRSVCVAHAGTHELSVIDAPALLAKLLALPAEPQAASAGEVLYDDRNEILDYFRRYRAGLLGGGEQTRYEDRGVYTLGDAAGVSNDLEFLAGVRRRIKLKGNGPRALAIVGAKAYVAEYFTDTLAVVDLRPGPSSRTNTLALGPRPQLTVRRRGEMLFNDAELCFQHWQSCASCHPQARMDGLNWDLTNDGQGNLQNTKSLLLAHKTPPAMSSGVRASAEAGVRAGIRHILFAVRPEREAVAIDQYLKSLKPVPSPRLIHGRLSPAAERGRTLFFSDRVGCHKCHPAPLYTDLRMADVGTKRPYDSQASFDTPTLIEAWRTAPYLHDGRYTTINELITKGKHGKSRGRIDSLNVQQIRDLVAFVLSL